MKRNIKKLAVFVMMAAIALFIPAATASAGDHDWGTKGDHHWRTKCDHHRNTIVGEYLYTGMNNCMNSPVPPGFTENNKAFTAKGPVTLSLGTLQGIFTFKPHGKGSVLGRQVSISLPQGITVTAGDTLPSASHPNASASAADMSYDFTYDVTHDGTITLEMVPGTYKVTVLTGPYAGRLWWDVDKISLSGLISDDYKTITLGSLEPASWILTYPKQDAFPNGMTSQSICGTWRSLTRVEELYR